MGGALIHLTAQRQNDRQRMAAYAVVARAAVILEHELSRTLSSAYTLASWVRKHKGDTAGFVQFADNLIHLHGDIDQLQLVTRDEVLRAEPANTAPRARDEAAPFKLSTRESPTDRKLHLIGPVSTINGAQTVIGYLPIFMRAGEHQDRHFWGYSVVHIDLQQLLRASNLHGLFSPRYRFALYKQLPSGRRLLAQSAGGRLERPVTIDVASPAGAWTLSAAPASGWASSPPTPAWLALLALSLLASGMAGYFVWQHALMATTALHDPLTGLPNRLLFHEQALLAIEQARRNHSHAAFLFLDLDNFKPINDAMGHGAGDRLLREVAARLKVSVRTVDTIARVGGDEFLLVLTNLKDRDYADTIAMELITVLERPFELDGTAVEVGVSIGMSVFPRDGDQLDDLIARADSAMYSAKRRGGRCYQDAAPPPNGVPHPEPQTQRT